MNGMENAKNLPYFALYKIFSIAFFASLIMKFFVRYKFDLYLIFSLISEIKSQMTNIDVLLTYNFFIVMILCFCRLVILFIGGEYYSTYFKFNFSYIFQILLFCSFAILNAFSASRSFFFMFPVLLAGMFISFVSHFLSSLFYQLQASIQKRYHVRLFSFNIFYIVVLIKFLIFLKNVVYITNDIYSNIYLIAVLSILFTISSSVIVHVMFLIDYENYGNSFKVVRNCFNLQSLNISVELILSFIIFSRFIIKNLHTSLFVPKNVSVHIPLDHYTSLFERFDKSCFLNSYYYMSPVYYLSSSANAIIELASQKVPFKSFQNLKSKSRNYQSSSSNFYSLFDEMRKILFVSKISAFSISNPSSTVPFISSKDSDPFSNYFLIKSSIKSFRNSPNFFRYYNMQMKDINYFSDNDDKNSTKKAKETKNNKIIKDKNKEDLKNEEYEDDEVHQICKVEESFFSFDPLAPLFTPSEYNISNTDQIHIQNISNDDQIHIQNKTEQKSTTAAKKKNYFLFINFLFYSNIRSNFDIKRSEPSDGDFEILIIFTFLIYIGFRLGLLIHNQRKFNEIQKEWKSLILLPNASTIDLIRCHYTCIICRNKMTPKTAKRLRCHHCIHLTCLIKWTKLRNKCPLCQDEIIMSQDGNGHYSYFYSYNRNIFSHTINKNHHNKISYFSDLLNFLTNKNEVQKINNDYNVDGVGKNSDEDEQNVSPYLLFYVCSLRKFRFLKRHLLIINKKCSSNLSDFIEKKKNKLNQNENNNQMDNFIIFNSSFNNEQINEFINENPGLWHFFNDFYYDNNDANRIINDDANPNDNNLNENNANDTQLANNNNEIVDGENTVNNNNNDINIDFAKKNNQRNNFIMNFNNESESGEEQAARRLVSQYKTRFEFDRSLINIVIQEMHNNFPFLLKEENFLNKQQKELRNMRNVNQEELEENIQFSYKISLMIKKYKAAFKEIEDEESWTRFHNPLDEI